MTATNETGASRRTLLSRVMLSVVTVAAAGGLMGFATFEAFDNGTDTVTRSVPAPATP